MKTAPDAAQSVPTEPLKDAVAEGMEILTAEREALLQGRYSALAEITERKTTLLSHLEDAMRAAPRTRAVQRLITGLIDAGRYNEVLLKAAREGLALAKRRIAAIRKAGRGAVAYAEDGSTITAAGDRWTSEHMA